MNTTFTNAEYTDIHFICGYWNGIGTRVVVEYRKQFPVWRLRVNMYLPECTRGWEKWAIHISIRECPVQLTIGEQDNILHTVESSPKTKHPENFLTNCYTSNTSLVYFTSVGSLPVSCSSCSSSATPRLCCSFTVLSLDCHTPSPS
jgi:hypothetical protein